MRMNDTIVSTSQGFFSEISRHFLLSWKLATYIYIYNHWRMVELPWNSAWTWFLCFVGVDFLYYWGHRASHEINFLWAAHQVHHSSEDYNLSTALRQSALQNFFMSLFNLPLALAIPPSAVFVHSSLNMLYQFWIHTEAIKSLGPLEFILNTASHHRVHHGRNRYCIDKNYGGVFIIWDRLFGTFEAEKEEVVYGLTHSINTFDPFNIQFNHYKRMWETFWITEGLGNKLSVLYKGPGWSPGKPWHGSIEDIPNVKYPVSKYDPPLPFWCKLYIFWHGTILMFGFMEISDGMQKFPPALLYGAIIYEVVSASAFAMMLEGRCYAPWVELLRIIAYIPLDYYGIPRCTRLQWLPRNLALLAIALIRLTFLASGLIWLCPCAKSVSIRMHSKKVK